MSVLIVKLYHQDFNKVIREKARWELYKVAVCCFEQILDAIPYKTAAEQQLNISQTIQVRGTRHVGYY